MKVNDFRTSCFRQSAFGEFGATEFNLSQKFTSKTFKLTVAHL